jgi:cysteine-S-conjugate beta-lyase
MTGTADDEPPLKPATRLVHAGRDKDLTGPFVNPPVNHASTVLFESVAEMRHPTRYTYGRRGTPTTNALENAIVDLEGAAGAVICPSGLSAAAVALLAVAGAGDRVLMVDTVYGPVRHLAMTLLTRLGIETVFFDPAVGARIIDLMTPNTRAVYAEAPGSLTFEMLDLPAVAEAAHRSGAAVLFDNSWATPLNFRPLAAGADLAILSATKYLVGHSDAIIGTVSANSATWPRLKETHGTLGTHVGPDDVYLTLRGLRTLAVRIARHAQSGIKVAEWLASRPEVARVLYPPLPADPGHALWQRDMTGGCGLFSIVFAGWDDAKAVAFVDALALFGIGASWGGFESLAIVSHPEHSRSATRWSEGPLVRLHIGLEDPDDLITDLARAFAKAAA